MIDVKSTLTDAGERMEMAALYLEEQLSRIRAGRANIAILDGVRVSSYGSMVPLNQVANVSAPDHEQSLLRLGKRRQYEILRKQLWTQMLVLHQKTTEK